MQKRPEDPVGITDIILVVILLRQVESCESKRPVGNDLGLTVGRGPKLSTPAEPNAAIGLQGGADRNRQPTGIRSCLCAGGNPVGNYH